VPCAPFLMLDGRCGSIEKGAHGTEKLLLKTQLSEDIP